MKLVGGIVAAALENRGVHTSQDIALERIGGGELNRLFPRPVGKLGRLPHIGDLRRAFNETEQRDKLRCIDQRREAVQALLQFLAVGGSEPVGVVLDPQPFSFEPKLSEDPLQVGDGFGAGAVPPDAHVTDNRSEACLA